MGITKELQVIRACSTERTNMLEDLMEQYGVNSLGEVTLEMANEYIIKHPMIKRRYDYEKMVNGWDTSI